MENTCRQGSIYMCAGEELGEMLLTACTTRSNHRDGKAPAQLIEGFQGITLFGTVMVHRGEQDFATATLLALARPVEKFFAGFHASAIDINTPSLLLLPGIDGQGDKLVAIVAGYLIDQVRRTHGRRVDRYLIGSRLKEYTAPGCPEKRGVLAKYAETVASASEGAVTDKYLTKNKA